MLMFNKGQIFSLAGKRNAGGKNVGLVLNIHTAISAEADMKNVAKTNRLGIGQVEHASATQLSPCCTDWTLQYSTVQYSTVQHNTVQVEHASATLLSLGCRLDIASLFMICRWRFLFGIYRTSDV